MSDIVIFKCFKNKLIVKSFEFQCSLGLLGYKVVGGTSWVCVIFCWSSSSSLAVFRWSDKHRPAGLCGSEYGYDLFLDNTVQLGCEIRNMDILV